MVGYLIGLNTQTKSGLIEQARNKRRFAFDLSVWDADFKDITPNMEVEFELNNDKIQVILVRPKKNPNQAFTIRQTHSIKECIYEHFGGVENLIKHHKKDIDSKKDLDFLRIKRFLFTAYNNLFELDSTISNATLTSLKSELSALDREYESFAKKVSYPPQYSYQKIFLARQIEFVKMEELIESTQSLIKSTTIQQSTMGTALKTMEDQFAKRTDTNSAAYAQALSNLKKLRKRYVDLLQYLSEEKEKLAKATQARDTFSKEHFETFLRNYLPLTNTLKQDFIKLLNAKAYDLDTLLWERAKRSLSVRRFFIKAGITGTYSSKTFLKYFLYSLDKNKIRNEIKELFNLLKYLETFSKKNILLIQSSKDDSRRYKEYLKNFDKDLQITTSNDPYNHLSISNPVDYHIVIMEWEVCEMNILSFIQKYIELFSTTLCTPKFCAILPKNTSNIALTDIRKKGVDYYVTQGNINQFIDTMRMIL
ncbi:hypothetical protein [Helicobacter sp.]|uniref:hypothetical protein n=1 Tax=Helicobacter sp. TaxID=218 RepID=UPI0025B82070|nr:hypothetical protein [Helicobacter sp.]MCI5968937.1 hypothetical protein [Helicobacter sp.]MDY2584317.1 hypothetical protein [Helicobacter sp.]